MKLLPLIVSIFNVHYANTSASPTRNHRYQGSHVLDYQTRNMVYQQLINTSLDGRRTILPIIRHIDRQARLYIGDLPLWKHRLSKYCYPDTPGYLRLLFESSRLTVTGDLVTTESCLHQVLRMLDPDDPMWTGGAIERSIKTVPSIRQFVWLSTSPHQTRSSFLAAINILSRISGGLETLILRPRLDFNGLISDDDRERNRVETIKLIAAFMQLSPQYMRRLEISHHALTRLFYHNLRFYWSVVERLTGLQELTVHHILDNFDESDWIDVAGQAMSDLQSLRSISLHWEMSMSLDRAEKFADYLLNRLPLKQTLERLFLHGPGVSRVAQALGRRISEFSRLKSLQLFDFIPMIQGFPDMQLEEDPIWDYSVQFIEGLMAIEGLERVHLPSIPSGHVVNRLHQLMSPLTTTNQPRLSFTLPYKPTPLTSIWSIGESADISLVSANLARKFSGDWLLPFPPGSADDDEDDGGLRLPDNKPEELCGMRLIGSHLLQVWRIDPIGFIPPIAYQQLQSIEMEQVTLLTVQNLLERLHEMTALKQLKISLERSEMAENYAAEVRDFNSKLFSHPTMEQLELSINQYNPFHLIRLVEDLIQSGDRSKLRHLSIHSDNYNPGFSVLRDWLRSHLFNSDLLPSTRLQSARFTYGTVDSETAIQPPPFEINWQRLNRAL